MYLYIFLLSNFLISKTFTFINIVLDTSLLYFMALYQIQELDVITCLFFQILFNNHYLQIYA